MWRRIVRIFRSIFGFFIRRAEKPELILEQLIEDMKANLVNMRNNAVGVIATEKQLIHDIEKAQERVDNLDLQIRAAVKLGKDDVATTLIGAKTTEEKNLESLRAQLEKAKKASQQARELIRQYELKVQRAAQEKMALLSTEKTARMQEQLSSAMTAFNVNDDFETLDRMREKVMARAARTEARLELGADTVEGQIAEVEMAATNLEAQEQLAEYKRQLGLAEEPAEPVEKTMEPLPEEQVVPPEAEQQSQE